MIRNDPDPDPGLGPDPDPADRTPDRGVDRDREAEPDPDTEVGRDPTIGAAVVAVDLVPEVALARASVPTRGPIREVEHVPEADVGRKVCPDRDPRARARLAKSSRKTWRRRRRATIKPTKYAKRAKIASRRLLPTPTKNVKKVKKRRKRKKRSTKTRTRRTNNCYPQLLC